MAGEIEARWHADQYKNDKTVRNLMQIMKIKAAVHSNGYVYGSILKPTAMTTAAVTPRISLKSGTNSLTHRSATQGTTDICKRYQYRR